MIITIVGPTGVGKTKISEKLSDKLNAIVINADAVQIYKELNIGSAKPKADELSNQKHFLFDHKNIKENYNVFDYQKDLRNILDKNKDKNIIIVGGTGLYIKAGLYDYNFSNELNDEQNNLLYKTIFIGLKVDRALLYERINQRVDKMIEEGLVEEVKSLYRSKNDSRVLNTAIGYREIISYLDNLISLEEAIRLIKKNSRKYAKRQFTWFNNKMNINWFDVNLNNTDQTIEDILSYIKKESV
jgi:tRNA dimethylallyltransferase